jgi:hypothetical protein
MTSAHLDRHRVMFAALTPQTCRNCSTTRQLGSLSSLSVLVMVDLDSAWPLSLASAS